MKIFIAALVVLIHLFFSSANTQAGGSLSYDDIREKFYVDYKVLFDTLEQGIVFTNNNAWADVRIGSDVSEKWGGLRLGPYRICAKQKYEEHLQIRVIITTELSIFGKNGQEVNEISEAEEVKERITGVLIELVDLDKDNYFPRCQ